MGCNCKKKIDYVEKKYGVGNVDLSNNIIVKIFKSIFQVVFGLLLGCIAAVLCIPFLIFVTVNFMLGKEPSVDIGKVMRIKNTDKNE